MWKIIVLSAIGIWLPACASSPALTRGPHSSSFSSTPRNPSQQIVELPLVVEQNEDAITVRGAGDSVPWFRAFFQGFYASFATAWATLCPQPRCLPLPWTVTVSEGQARTVVVGYGTRLIHGQLPADLLIGQRAYSIRDTASVQSAAQRAARHTAERLLAVGPWYGFR